MLGLYLDCDRCRVADGLADGVGLSTVVLDCADPSDWRVCNSHWILHRGRAGLSQAWMRATARAFLRALWAFVGLALELRGPVGLAGAQLPWDRRITAAGLPRTGGYGAAAGRAPTF